MFSLDTRLITGRVIDLDPRKLDLDKNVIDSDPRELDLDKNRTQA